MIRASRIASPALFLEWEGGGEREACLNCETLSSCAATTPENAPSAGGFHAASESVFARSFAFFRLIRALGHATIVLLFLLTIYPFVPLDFCG